MTEKPKLETGEVLIWPHEVCLYPDLDYSEDISMLAKLIQDIGAREVEYLKERGYTNISIPTAQFVTRPDGQKLVRFQLIVFATPCRNSAPRDKQALNHAST